MKKLLLYIVSLFVYLSVFSQVDTTKIIPKINANGYAWKNGQFDSSMSIPLDTFKLKSTWRGISAKGNTPYFWNGTKWVGFAAASAVDTSNAWVNTITKNTAGDSIIFYIGSTRYAIKDSTGGGGSTIGSITGLSDSLLNKANRDGSNAYGSWNINAATVTNGVYTSRSISTGYGLTGGGDFSTDRTHVVDSATLANYFLRRKDSSINGGYYPYSTNPKNYLTSIPNLQQVTDVSGLTTNDLEVINDAGNIILYDSDNEKAIYLTHGTTSSRLGFVKNFTELSYLEAENVTGNKTWQLPNASGTLALTSDISGKLNISDTASMLSYYVREADSAAMLSNYLRKGDTTAMLSGYKTFYPRTAISLTTTGTSGAATYDNSTGVFNIPNYTTDISGKLNISDTATMLSYYVREADSSTMLSNYFNTAGWGTIRSGQALRVDSGLVTSRAWHQKAIDSLAALIPTITASNGLTKTGNDIALGGTLTGNTTIIGTTYKISLTSNQATNPFSSTNSGGGTGFYGTSVTGQGISGSASGSGGSGVYGTATDAGGTGVVGIGNAGIGIRASSDDGLPLSIQKYATDSTTSVPMIKIFRQTAGTAQDNIGSSIDYYNNTTSGAPLSTQLISKWATANNATRTSQFDIMGVSNTATETFANFQTGGIVRVNNLADTLATKAYARSVGGGSGETNTASTVGGGLGVFDTKVGVDLRFRSLNANDFDTASGKIYIDYTNGQAASASTKGFLTAADFNTLNKGTATYTVAASNSPAVLKARADYICDGTNDEVEIRAALLLGNVQAVEGTYNISDTIQIPSNRTLSGTGDATIFKGVGFTTTSKMFTSYSTTNIVLKDFTIDGNSTDTTGYGIYFELVGTGAGSTATIGALVENIYFKNIYQSGVEFQSCRNSIISKTRATGIFWDAIVLKKKTGEAKGCVNVSLTYNKSYNSTAGVWAQQSEYINIEGNYAEGDASNANGQIGYQIESNCYRVTLKNNTARNNVDNNFYVSDSKFTNLEGNTADSTSFENYYITGNSDSSSLVNNSSTRAGKDGIYIDAPNALVSNNYVSESSTTSNNNYSGIAIYNTYATVISNRVSKGSSVNKQKYGILTTAGSTGTVVFGNNLKDAGVTSDMSLHSSNKARSNVANDGTWKDLLYTAHELEMNTSKLLGRTTASQGKAEEIGNGYGVLLSSGSIIIDTATLSGKYLRLADSTALNGYATQYDLSLLTGGSQTLQQVFDIETGEALLNKNDTINLNDNGLKFISSGANGHINTTITNGNTQVIDQITGSGVIHIISNSSNNFSSTYNQGLGVVDMWAELVGGGKYSQLRIESDSVIIRPNAGYINIDSLQTTSDTVNYKPAAWNPVNGSFRKFNYWPSGAGGSGDMVLANVQSVTGLKTFDKDKLAMKGTSTGVTTLSTANTSGTSYTATLQAASGTIAYLSDITGGVSDGDKGDITVSSSGTVWTFDYKRNIAYTTSTATDADITAAAGTTYSLPAATLSANRNIDMTNVSTNGDYVEIDNQEAGFTWTFTGQTVYDAFENAVTVLLTNTRYIIRRTNGKLKIIN